MSTEQVHQNIAELNSLNGQIRRWKIVAAVSCLVITFTGILVLRNSAQRLVDKGPARDQFFAEFSDGLRREVVPQVATLTLSTVDKLMPRVQNEVVKLEIRTPELSEAVTRELELLQQNLPARARKALESTLGRVITEREPKIRAMFPEITDEKVTLMFGNLTDEGQRRFETIGAEIATPFEQSVQEILADLETIRESEAASVAAEPVTWNLAVLCVNLLQDNLQQTAPAEYNKFMKETFQKEAK